MVQTLNADDYIRNGCKVRVADNECDHDEWRLSHILCCKFPRRGFIPSMAVSQLCKNRRRLID